LRLIFPGFSEVNYRLFSGINRYFTKFVEFYRTNDKRNWNVSCSTSKGLSNAFFKIKIGPSKPEIIEKKYEPIWFCNFSRVASFLEFLHNGARITKNHYHHWIFRVKLPPENIMWSRKIGNKILTIALGPPFAFCTKNAKIFLPILREPILVPGVISHEKFSGDNGLTYFLLHCAQKLKKGSHNRKIPSGKRLIRLLDYFRFGWTNFNFEKSIG